LCLKIYSRWRCMECMTLPNMTARSTCTSAFPFSIPWTAFVLQLATSCAQNRRPPARQAFHFLPHDLAQLHAMCMPNGCRSSHEVWPCMICVHCYVSHLRSSRVCTCARHSALYVVSLEQRQVFCAREASVNACECVYGADLY
jgi:hypothetical protein